MRLTVLLLLGLAQAAPQPVFKSGVNLVEVDVVVSDKSGQPVRGLSRGDFQVFEDGKPVELSTFVAIDLAAAPATASLPAPDHSGSSLGSNDQPERCASRRCRCRLPGNRAPRSASESRCARRTR